MFTGVRGCKFGLCVMCGVSQVVREKGDLGRHFIGSDTGALSGGTDSVGVNPALSGV